MSDSITTCPECLDTGWVLGWRYIRRKGWRMAKPRQIFVKCALCAHAGERAGRRGITPDGTFFHVLEGERSLWLELSKEQTPGGNRR